MSADAGEHLIAEVLVRYRDVLRERLADEPQTLDAIERAVEVIGQRLETKLE